MWFSLSASTRNLFFENKFVTLDTGKQPLRGLQTRLGLVKTAKKQIFDQKNRNVLETIEDRHKVTMFHSVSITVYILFVYYTCV